MSLPAVLRRLFSKFSFRSSDPCGQIEPREDDKSDHSRVSPRLRDNPAVCHLNSFGGGRVLAQGKMSQGADRSAETGGREVQRGTAAGETAAFSGPLFVTKRCHGAQRRGSQATTEPGAGLRGSDPPRDNSPVAVTRPSVEWGPTTNV